MRGGVPNSFRGLATSYHLVLLPSERARAEGLITIPDSPYVAPSGAVDGNDARRGHLAKHDLGRFEFPAIPREGVVRPKRRENKQADSSTGRAGRQAASPVQSVMLFKR